MTTIVIHDGVIAYDSRVSEIEGTAILLDYVDKCFVSDRHPVIYCGFGAVTAWMAAVRHLESKAKLPWEHACWKDDTYPGFSEEEDAGLFVVDRDGNIYCFEGSGFYKLKTKTACGGTGARVAHAAILCGAPAEEAVLIAIKLDTASGPPVNVLRIADLPAARKHVNGSRPSATAAGRRAKPAPQQIRRTEEYSYARAARAGRARARDQR